MQIDVHRGGQRYENTWVIQVVSVGVFFVELAIHIKVLLFVELPVTEDGLPMYLRQSSCSSCSSNYNSYLIKT